MATYVYGIVGSGTEAPRAAGIADAPLELIAAGGAAALVSELPGTEPRLGREEILTHSRVLEEAMSAGTVLPMRFGMVMQGAEVVRERLLDAHAPELMHQLEQLAGKLECNVRVVYDEEALMRDVVQRDTAIARLRDSLRGKPDDATYYERIRLGELVAEAVDRLRQLDAGEIIDALAPLAVDLAIADPAHERVVVSASFLVERDRL